MHNLVVCGATSPVSVIDGAIFSNFMGVSLTLRDLNPNTTQCSFYSSFPLREHFDYLSTFDPPIGDIKWGSFGPKRNPLYSYSKTEFMLRQGLWYQEYDKDELIGKVVAWIHEKAATTNPGDTVNIFFHAHGRPDGSVVLGSKALATEDFKGLLRLFRAGVQVNAVGSHCYSGVFVDAIPTDNQSDRYIVSACGPKEGHWTASRSVSGRYRNFRFSQPLVQPLARLALPGVPPPTNDPISVSEHDAYMAPAMRTVTPGNTARPTTYDSFLSAEKQAALTQLEQLVLCDFADVAFQATNVTRRRSLEWPGLDLTLLRRLKEKPFVSLEADRAELAGFVSGIAAACTRVGGGGPTGTSLYWHIKDDIALSPVDMPNPNYEHALKILYARGREQAAIWDIFCILEQRGLVSMTSLIKPINFDKLDEMARRVVSVLYQFEMAGSFTDVGDADMPAFDFALIWLAAVIARGCHNLGLVYETIHFTGIIGPLNFGAVQAMDPEILSITCDKDIMAGEGDWNRFGAWLPHGIGDNLDKWDVLIDEAIEKFNNVERLFKKYFKIPDGELPGNDEENRPKL